MKDAGKGDARGVTIFTSLMFVPFVILYVAWCIEQLCKKDNPWQKAKNLLDCPKRFLAEFLKGLKYARKLDKYRQEERRRSCSCVLGGPCVINHNNRSHGPSRNMRWTKE